MIFPQIYNKKVVNSYFVNYGTLGAFGTPAYYLQGYMTIYSNGMKTVIGGGGSGGSDVMDATLLDKKNNIIASDTERC